MYRIGFTLAAFIIFFSAFPLAAQEENTLGLMQSHTGTLNADFPVQEWTYTPGSINSTVTVETLSGTLDPVLELVNADGEVIAQNNDFAPSFSTSARLGIPAGGTYTLRVTLAYGEGDYHITALPGGMYRQWNDDLDAGNAYWAAVGASSELGTSLETPMTVTRLFTPDGSPSLTDLYIQATLHWGNVRSGTEAGLVVRGRHEANGQISGWRLEINPAGEWFLRWNDITGVEMLMQQGRLPNESDGVTLGLLAEGERIAFFADGVLLGEVRDTQPPQNDEWGISVFDGQVFLEDFWLATPARPAPEFPANLTSWDSGLPLDITNELIERGVIPPDGAHRLHIASTIYTVGGGEQRSFLITEPDMIFDDLVMGGDILIMEGDDVGCGLVAKLKNRGNRLLTFADNQNGAGLLWWSGSQLRINNYFLVENPTPARYRLLLVIQGDYAAFYVNGMLTAQALVPRRAGNVGVGFMNYAERPATCEFRDVWVWD